MVRKSATTSKTDEFGDTQASGTLTLPIEKGDTCWIDLLNKKFFPKLATYCARKGRDANDLNKISTGADWNTYRKCTGVEGLVDHSGKWFFGHGRDDLDEWELELMDTHGFGSNVDWSWINAKDPMQAFMEKHAKTSV